MTGHKCKSSRCLHNSKEILESDEMIVHNNSYYHKDCFKAQQDIQYIKSLWYNNIDKLVVFKQLIDVLNGFIYKDKIESDYIVFAVEYCINKHLNLHYPHGLKYFLGKKEIKESYTKSKIKIVPSSVFHAPKDTNDPSFTFNTTASNGFSNILGGGKN